MSESTTDLERDIEESRARLDLTINRIQDRLSVSGIVDDLMGSVKATQFGPVFDTALAVVRRNPVPVLLAAAGIGWLLYRMSQDESGFGHRTYDAGPAEDIPVLNTGNARVYDPDLSPRHPTHDMLETRRDASARA